MTTREIDGLGRVEEDPSTGWWFLDEDLAPPMLGGATVELAIDADPSLPVVAAAVARFRAAPRRTLDEAAGAAFAYYRDVTDRAVALGWPTTLIESATTVWDHVQFGAEAIVQVEDETAYVVVECNCDWEVEHGLQIVLRDGDRVTRISPFDGHLHNEDGQVYRPLGT